MSRGEIGENKARRAVVEGAHRARLTQPWATSRSEEVPGAAWPCGIQAGHLNVASGGSVGSAKPASSICRTNSAIRASSAHAGVDRVVVAGPHDLSPVVG